MRSHLLLPVQKLSTTEMPPHEWSTRMTETNFYKTLTRTWKEAQSLRCWEPEKKGHNKWTEKDDEDFISIELRCHDQIATRLWREDEMFEHSNKTLTVHCQIELLITIQVHWGNRERKSNHIVAKCDYGLVGLTELWELIELCRIL